MFIALDIGNSNYKAATFNKNKISGFNIFEDIESLMEFLSNKKVNAAAVSSVVPKKLRYLEKRFKSFFGFEPIVINRDSKFNIKIRYKTPETLGIDRICSAEGAFYLYNQGEISKRYNKNVFILSIDFGTATTINVIKYNGIYTGGLIAPGIGMMFRALKNETAQLPIVKPADYKEIIGDSTKTSIASGVINSTLGVISQTITYFIKKNKAYKIIIYVTGGNAEYLLPYLKFKFIYEKGLVLYGIKSVYENTIKFR